MLKNVVEINKHKNRDTSQPKHEEYQYLNLLKDIINEGSMEEGRNGNTKAVIGTAMHFSLENGQIPILTTKKTAWKTCLKELLWFISGSTDAKLLSDQNVHIWDGNTTAEFLESRGLSHYTPGRQIGPLYSAQWRHWGAKYETDPDVDYTGKGIDQLQKAIDMLKDPNQRNSRRIIVSAWNVEQLDQGVLPPCHSFFQFSVTEGNKLSCSLLARSQDVPLGEPFNICSYAFLTHLIAKHCDLIPHEFILFGGNCHIYEPHIEAMKEQITREPYEFPTVEILNKRDDINDYVLADFKVTDYKHHPQIKMTMVA